MARPYRGKRSGGCLIPTLCILCVIAALILFFINRNLIYTSDGTQLKLPFTDKTISLGDKPEQDPEDELEEIELIIEEPVQYEPEPPTLSDYQARVEKSVFVPMSLVINPASFDAFLEKLNPEKINTVILQVKDDSGKLAFVSAQPAAVSYGSNAASNDAVKSALEKVKAAGFNACAQMSCFRDNSATRAKRPWAVGTNDALVWLDPQENRWLNPFVAQARDYLVALMGEIYDLGFSEILLDKVAFPTNGIQSIISYGANTDKVGAINAFITSAKAMAQQKGGQVAAVYNNTAPTETQQYPGGQDLTSFVSELYRIYVPVKAGDASVAESMSQTIGAGFATRFVAVVEVNANTDISALGPATASGNGCMYKSADGVYPAGLCE